MDNALVTVPSVKREVAHRWRVTWAVNTYTNPGCTCTGVSEQAVRHESKEPLPYVVVSHWPLQPLSPTCCAHHCLPQLQLTVAPHCCTALLSPTAATHCSPTTAVPTAVPYCCSEISHPRCCDSGNTSSCCPGFLNCSTGVMWDQTIFCSGAAGCMEGWLALPH